ncbi:MAG: hypothetical protein M3179_12160 [Actinomycetota bacterium]|nr:hypothetical protein [Actinomycetota bacterium]
MAVWVVVLEAVVDKDVGSPFNEDDLVALSDALADNFAVVAGTDRSYEAELWVEDNMPSGALLSAERLVQYAARDVGLRTTEFVRAEVRSARAIEEGLVAYGAAPGQLQAERAAEEAKAARAAKRAAAKEAGTEKAAKKAVARKKTVRKTVKKTIIEDA